MMTALLIMPKPIVGNQMKVRMPTLILPKMVIVGFLMLLLRLMMLFMLQRIPLMVMRMFLMFLMPCTSSMIQIVAWCVCACMHVCMHAHVHVYNLPS